MHTSDWHCASLSESPSAVRMNSRMGIMAALRQSSLRSDPDRPSACSASILMGKFGASGVSLSSYHAHTRQTSRSCGRGTVEKAYEGENLLPLIHIWQAHCKPLGHASEDSGVNVIWPVRCAEDHDLVGA